MRPIAFRTSILLLAAACCVVVVGCETAESVRSTVKDRFEGAPPNRVRTVEGNPRQVYDAARKAMGDLGYRVTGGGAAQGRLEGFSRIGEDNSFRSSRQRSITIHLQGLDGGRVEVQVRMTEIVEDGSNRSAMPATETPLRDPASFDVFFENLERCLATAKAK